MTRITKIAMTICLLCALCVCVAAESPISITAPDEAIVGQIVPLEIKIPADGYSKVECTLSVDEQQAQIQSLPEAQGWDIDFLGKNIILTRNEEGPAQVHLQLKLKILPVLAQTKIRVSVLAVTGFDANGPEPLGDATKEITVVQPPSHENFLMALSVENSTLLPQFHPDILQYSATVFADCQQPQVYAVGAEKSRVEVSQTEFNEEGICAVAVTVTAENGSQRNYTIQVTRDKPVETLPPTTVATQPETRPNEPTKATKPTKPMESTKATESIEATKPTKPMESTKATEPTTATESTKATQPTEPTQPMEPTQLTETTQPTNPVQPTQPSQQTKPTKPIETTQPTHATRPDKPTQEPSDDVSVERREEEVPGWLVAAAVLAGAALGGAGGILLSEKRNKDR